MLSLWRASTLALAATILNEQSLAQTTDAICLPYFDWMSNSQHQSPCTVASSLLAICNGGSYNVIALPVTTHYTGPVSVFDANDCQCNTVTYSLMSACAACQGRSYLAWSEWAENCPKISTDFPRPLPSTLHVPGWAYLDPTPSDNFNQMRAQQNTNLTESVLPTPTISVDTEHKHSKSSLSTTHRPSTSNRSHSSSSTIGIISASSRTTPSLATSPVDLQHANTIGGIASGAAAAVLLLVCVVFWFVNSRIAGRKDKKVLESHVEDKNFTDVEKGPRMITKVYEESVSNLRTHHNATALSSSSSYPL